MSEIQHDELAKGIEAIKRWQHFSLNLILPSPLFSYPDHFFRPRDKLNGAVVDSWTVKFVECPRARTVAANCVPLTLLNTAYFAAASPVWLVCHTRSTTLSVSTVYDPLLLRTIACIFV
jgi:hypothetical protein